MYDFALLKMYLELLNNQWETTTLSAFGVVCCCFFDSLTLWLTPTPYPLRGEWRNHRKERLWVSCNHYLQVSWAGSCFWITPFLPTLWRFSHQCLLICHCGNWTAVIEVHRGACALHTKQQYDSFQNKYLVPRHRCAFFRYTQWMNYTGSKLRAKERCHLAKQGKLSSPTG